MWLSHKRGRAQTHGRRDGVGPSSGWLGDRQRACPRFEAGETGAAEPGQAETGPANQATQAPRPVEVRATGRRTEEARDRTRGCSGIEGERTGGHRTSVRSHHSHEGSNDATRSEQNTGRGLRQQPCALQNRQLSISAPKLALCERDRIYEAAQ